MQISPKLKRRLRIQHELFVVLFLLFVFSLSWLASITNQHWDWTQDQRNSLSDSSVSVVKRMSFALNIQAYVSETNSEMRRQVETLISRYQRHHANIVLNFIDPSKQPELVRKHAISAEGELILEYENRTDRLSEISEQGFTNGLMRLLHNSETPVLFLEGHGERSPHGGASYNYLNWRKQLEAKGFKIKSINLASNKQLEEQTGLLIIADSKQPLLANEKTQIREFLDKGGNLLWLTEPKSNGHLNFLAEYLGIEMLPGTIVDLSAQLVGIEDPRFAIVSDYTQHPITFGFNLTTVFPIARALEFNGDEQWDSEVFLETLPRSWSETDELKGELVYDSQHDIIGPLGIGIALTRPLTKDQFDQEFEKNNDVGVGDALAIDDEPLSDDTQQAMQRIVIIGDADFISDAYLGQAGNQELAINIVNWLSESDDLLNIPATIPFDANLQLSVNEKQVLSVLFMALMPIVLLAIGLAIFFKRRRA